MAREFCLRGHHLRNFQIYLKAANTDARQIEFFNGIVSSEKNRIILADFNDKICERCDSADEDYCANGKERMRKEIVAKHDRYLATEVFGMPMERPLPVLYVIERIIPPPFLTGISPEDLLHSTPTIYRNMQVKHK